MKFTLFIGLVTLLVLVVWLFAHFGKVVVVSHARLLFKTWSLWLASAGSVLSAWVQSFPDAAIEAWGSLPQEMKACIPPNFLGMVGALLVAMAVMAQFIRQKKLAQQCDALAGGKV